MWENIRFHLLAPIFIIFVPQLSECIIMWHTYSEQKNTQQEPLEEGAGEEKLEVGKTCKNYPTCARARFSELISHSSNLTGIKTLSRCHVRTPKGVKEHAFWNAGPTLYLTNILPTRTHKFVSLLCRKVHECLLLCIISKYRFWFVAYNFA